MAGVPKFYVSFKPTDKAVVIPEKASEAAAGYDLRCNDRRFDLYPGESKLVGTGVRLGIPEGYYGQIKSRSGLATKHGIEVGGGGVIDADYRGEIKVMLRNFGPSAVSINQYDRIAQLLFLPVQTALIRTTGDLPGYLKKGTWFFFGVESTKRGSNGFGSTGT